MNFVSENSSYNKLYNSSECATRVLNSNVLNSLEID